MKQNKTWESTPIIFLVLFMVLGLLQQVIGVIPVNGGLGWDGVSFFKHMQHVIDGEWDNIPRYFLPRLISFLPLIFIKKFGGISDVSFLVNIQSFINIFQLSLAYSIFYKVLLDRTNDTIKSLKIFLLFFLQWGTISGVYNPMLNDVSVILFSSIFLYLDSYKRFLLIPAMVISFFVFPGLFIVPIIFYVFPEDRDAKKINKNFVLILKSGYFLFSLLVLGFLFNWVVSKVTDDHFFKLVPASYGFTKEMFISNGQLLSLISLCFVFLFLYFVLGEFLKKALPRVKFDLKRIGISFLILVLCIGGYLSIPANGFLGPNFKNGVTFMALSAPFKSFISHFYYLGPSLAISFIYFFRRMEKVELKYALVLIIGTLPLSFVSETRQWVYFFPIFLLVWSSSVIKSSILNACLFYNFLFILPAFALQNSINAAWNNKEALSSSNYQVLFGKAGPWMNNNYYYTLGVISILCVFHFIYLSRKKTNL